MSKNLATALSKGSKMGLWFSFWFSFPFAFRSKIVDGKVTSVPFVVLAIVPPFLRPKQHVPQMPTNVRLTCFQFNKWLYVTQHRHGYFDYAYDGVILCWRGQQLAEKQTNSHSTDFSVFKAFCGMGWLIFNEILFCLEQRKL